MKAVRVATNNNFNCTIKEFRQLRKIESENTDSIFFVNSNINTKRLENLNKANYASVITVNPNIYIEPATLEKLNKVSKDKVAFLRVKWIPNNKDIPKLIKKLRNLKYNVVITLQRFNGKETLLKYTSLNHYIFDCSRYRLYGKALQQVKNFAIATGSYICDEKGLGCQGCKLCSKLTCGQEIDIYSLNLSSSGKCPYNCPDCYAKTMYNFLEQCGKNPVYDVIKRNRKQQGQTKHIKNVWDMKAELELEKTIYEKSL